MGESITPVFHQRCEGSQEHFHGTLGIHTQWSYYNGAVTPPHVDVLASVSWSAEGNNEDSCFLEPRGGVT